MNTILNKIHLKKLKLKDINKKYLSWLNDKQNQKFLELKNKITLYDLKKYFYDKDKGNLFGIYYNINHIGNINIKPLSKKSCYIGFILGDKKFRSKGISSYAVSLAILKCFNYYKYNRIYSNCDKRNIYSFKLLKKNNFKKIKNIPSFLKRQNNDITKKRKLIYFCLRKKNITKLK
tara:strand:- start:204 stop:731 length:528 start_codon:yes stop_codon:yes gene_type:complete